MAFVPGTLTDADTPQDYQMFRWGRDQVCARSTARQRLILTLG